jgi:DNA-binding CsgD family transcriptional regulator
LIRLGWSRENPAFRQVFSSLFIPGGNLEQIQQFNELQRSSTSAENAARIVTVIDSLDVTEAARRLRVPTLAMHCEGDARIPFSEGRHLAGEIPGARFVPLQGKNHIMLEGEPAWDRFMNELVRFTEAEPATQPAAPAGGPNRRRLTSLTAREKDVLALVATGMGNAAIAESLHLSPKTVRNYLTRILDKLEVASRGEAIVAAREAGLGVSRPER